MSGGDADLLGSSGPCPYCGARRGKPSADSAEYTRLIRRAEAAATCVGAAGCAGGVFHTVAQVAEIEDACEELSRLSMWIDFGVIREESQNEIARIRRALKGG